MSFKSKKIDVYEFLKVKSFKKPTFRTAVKFAFDKNVKKDAVQKRAFWEANKKPLC